MTAATSPARARPTDVVLRFDRGLAALLLAACSAAVVAVAPSDEVVAFSPSRRSGAAFELGVRALGAVTERWPVANTVSVAAALLAIFFAAWATGSIAGLRRLAPAAAALAPLTLLALGPLTADVRQAAPASMLHLAAFAALVRADSSPEGRVARRLAAVAGVCSASAVLCRCSTWFAVLPLLPWLVGVGRPVADGRLSGPYARGLVAVLAAAGIALVLRGETRAYLLAATAANVHRDGMLNLGIDVFAADGPLTLVAYAAVVPGAVSWLADLRRVGAGAAWRAHAVEVTCACSALCWLAMSPFPTESLAVRVAVGGPWIALTAAALLARSVLPTESPSVAVPGARTDHRARVVGAAVLVATAAAAVVFEHGWLLEHPSAIATDEGYLGAFAIDMIRGHWLPYVDAVSHRGPLLYWLTAAAQWVFGPYRWYGVRLLAFGAVLTTVLACGAVPWMIRRPVAGGIAALAAAWSFVVGIQPKAGAALNGELAGTPFPVLALLLLLVVARRPSRAPLAFVTGAGALFALGALTKQTLLVYAVPLVVFLVLTSRAHGKRETYRRLGAFAIGAIVPVGLVVARYAIAGQLGALWYWLYGYNRDIYMAPFAHRPLSEALTKWFADEPRARVHALVVVVGAATASVFGLSELGRVRRSRAAGADPVEPALGLSVALFALFSIASALAPLRFWPHYFVQTVPWLSLLFALGTDRVLSRRADGAPTGALAAMALYGTLLSSGTIVCVEAMNDAAEAGRWAADPSSDRICKAVAALSAPGEPILVWGFDADIYVSCGRPPATEYVYSTLVAGIVPPFWSRSDDRWVVPHARENTARELRERRPPLVLEDRELFAGRSIQAVPFVRDAILEGYCPPRSITGDGLDKPRRWSVYVRKDLDCDRLAGAPLTDVYQPFVHHAEWGPEHAP